MADIKIMVEATRQLNQAWKNICNNLEKEAVSSNLYDALYEVDEAVGDLIEKVGEAAKIITIGSIKK